MKKRPDLSHYNAELRTIFGGCALCRERGASRGDKDHISARSISGDDSYGNLWLLCHNCHYGRKPLLDFLLGSNKLKEIRDLRHQWFYEKCIIKDLALANNYPGIVRRLSRSYYREFILKCYPFEEIAIFLEDEITGLYCKRIPPSFLFQKAELCALLSSLHDRNKKITEAIRYARAALTICDYLKIGEEVTLLTFNGIPTSLRSIALEYLAHALIKKKLIAHCGKLK